MWGEEQHLVSNLSILDRLHLGYLQGHSGGSVSSSLLISWVWDLFIGWRPINSSKDQIKDPKKGNCWTEMTLEGMGEIRNSPPEEQLIRGKQRWPILWDRKEGGRIVLSLVSLKMESVNPRAYPVRLENYSTSELGLWNLTDPGSKLINKWAMFHRSHFWCLQNGTDTIYHMQLWVLNDTMQSS